MQSMGSNDIFVTLRKKNAEKQDINAADFIDGIKYPVSSSGFGDIKDEDLITAEMLSELAKTYEDKIYAISIVNEIGTVPISTPNGNGISMLYAVSAGFFVENSLDFVAGSMFSEHNLKNEQKVIIISDVLAEKLFGEDYVNHIGETVKVSAGDDIKDDIELSVVGIYKYSADAVKSGGGLYSMMNMMDTTGAMSSSYMPANTLWALEHQEPKYFYARIITKVGVEAENFSDEIMSFFEPYYRNSEWSITAFSMKQMAQMLTDMLNIFFKAISIVAGIALFVGGIGVMNIMLVSVTERTREIGTRKALGAKNSSIRTQFIVEAMIICLIGGIIGVITGILAGTTLAKLLGYPAFPSIGGVIIALVFSMAVGLFFGYYPANKAAKMNPIDALRYE